MFNSVPHLREAKLIPRKWRQNTESRKIVTLEFRPRQIVDGKKINEKNIANFYSRRPTVDTKSKCLILCHTCGKPHLPAARGSTWVLNILTSSLTVGVDNGKLLSFLKPCHPHVISWSWFSHKPFPIYRYCSVIVKTDNTEMTSKYEITKDCDVRI